MLGARHNFVQYYNFFLWNGKLYSTLADIPINSSSSFCQTFPITLPDNARLAQDSKDTRSVIETHTWGSDIVLIDDGIGYGSFRNKTKAIASAGHLASAGGQYWVTSCPAQILIICKHISIFIYQ